MAKHHWRVLEPFHFLNPLGYCHMSRGANALLLVASVSSKAVYPTLGAQWLPAKALPSAEISPRKFAACRLKHHRRSKVPSDESLVTFCGRK
ncbi:hypothetical protein M1D52_01115 [Olivibacter sp. SA151]|uniref:hypothetical protein n=1 Tax=Olivibacter jilunii TaxID=985016 RepID=UPI00280E53A1